MWVHIRRVCYSHKIKFQDRTFCPCCANGWKKKCHQRKFQIISVWHYRKTWFSSSRRDVKHGVEKASAPGQRNIKAGYISTWSGSQNSRKAERHLIRLFITHQKSLSWKISAALDGRGGSRGVDKLQEVSSHISRLLVMKAEAEFEVQKEDKCKRNSTYVICD